MIMIIIPLGLANISNKWEHMHSKKGGNNFPPFDNYKEYVVDPLSDLFNH